MFTVMCNENTVLRTNTIELVLPVETQWLFWNDSVIGFLSNKTFQEVEA